MCYKENERGPFVVYVLPAILGCLTLILIRRWLGTPVSNTSSTAVSRRRKIIKDPLIKRPLHSNTYKMMPPSSKKNGNVAKKGLVTVQDEDMNGGSKRVGRPARLLPNSSPTIGATDIKVAEGTIAPKHIPFPFIPQDGELLFEAMTFVFTLVATGLQFLNLYRTAWWLPHSYTNQAMNFYLIDPHLVAFIVTIISRGFLLTLSLALLRTFLNPKLMPHATIAARMFILGVVLGALAWCSYFIVLKYTPLKVFYLLYPAIIYFLLFGFQSSPFLELNNSETPPLHCCSHDPQQLRAEVEMLKEDFNLRVKKILFNSVIGAYYSSFIPCCFAQSYVYYDVYLAAQQVALVWAGLCGRYASQLLAAAYCDVPHRAALHLRRQHCAAEGESEENPWNEAQFQRFQAVFSNPSTLLCVLVCMQLPLIIVQLFLLFSTIPWHNFISIIILLFINYYTLFKVMRDYLIAWKVYKAENLIQDKNGILQPLVN